MWAADSAILRGVAGQLLPCGCLAGTYELYDGRLITLVDARGSTCVAGTHREGAVLERTALRSRAAG